MFVFLALLSKKSCIKGGYRVGQPYVSDIIETIAGSVDDTAAGVDADETSSVFLL